MGAGALTLALPHSPSAATRPIAPIDDGRGWRTGGRRCGPGLEEEGRGGEGRVRRLSSAPSLNLHSRHLIRTTAPPSPLIVIEMGGAIVGAGGCPRKGDSRKGRESTGAHRSGARDGLFV